MEELLSLKWNNHRNSFLQELSKLRKKSNYSDVTLACDGNLYNVHKIILSACSEYFSSIFEKIHCANPVIILKDITASNLESLLDYMYLGDVSVRQSDLPTLIKAAECLKLKGLAVPDNEDLSGDCTKRHLDSPSSLKKKRRKSTSNETLYNYDSFERQTSDSPPSIKTHSDMKSEVSVTIKEESLTNNEDLNVWEDTSDPFDKIPINVDPNEQTVNDTSQNDAIHHSFTCGVYNESENSTESEKFSVQPSGASSSHTHGNEVINSSTVGREQICTYCNKTFPSKAHLRMHIRIHTGERPFACPYCSYKAAQKGSLTFHLINRHHQTR